MKDAAGVSMWLRMATSLNSGYFRIRATFEQHQQTVENVSGFGWFFDIYGDFQISRNSDVICHSNGAKLLVNSIGVGVYNLTVPPFFLFLD
jgi:hypothetical protein